jgi:hypothetical protein
MGMRGLGRLDVSEADRQGPIGRAEEWEDDLWVTN